MFNQIGSLEHAGKILNMLGAKQKIIGENLANVDTPGYTKKTMNFSDYLNPDMNGLEKKINAKFGKQSVTGIENTGQTVNMADEIIDMQQNSIMYSLASRRMTSAITEMKTAINMGR
ncbi:hypothetical protein IJ732_05105 [bacterium]|nr:hypothetical protein [bacterium]